VDHITTAVVSATRDADGEIEDTDKDEWRNTLRASVTTAFAVARPAPP
jgi:hypothetical protein